MSVINLKIVVSSVETVMETFDKIKVYRSTTGLSGSYAEITDVSTRIALVASTSVYEYQDTAGDPTYYYKTSYYNSVSTLESSLSDGVQGEGDPALHIVSVEELKTYYLFGVDLTDDEGTPYPDALYEWYIKSAVSWVEHRLDLPLRPKCVTTEKHDFVWDDYQDYVYLRLREYPVIEVSQVQMVLPSNSVVHTFDTDWFQLRKDSGVLHIVPGTGSAGTVVFGSGALWYPLSRITRRFVPDVFRVDYTAGFESGEVPADIKDVVGKVASFGPLNIAGDLLGGAGIASQNLSIDGLSQGFNTTSSATNSGYGARILQYNKEIKEQIPTLRRYYKGISMAVC